MGHEADDLLAERPVSNNPEVINRPAFDKAVPMDATLDRAGLESIAPLARFPRVVEIGDQIFLRVLVDGRDIEVEVPPGIGFAMMKDLAHILSRVCRV